MLLERLTSKYFPAENELEYKFLFYADHFSTQELYALEKEMNRSMKDHYRLQKVDDSHFYLHRIEKKGK